MRVLIVTSIYPPDIGGPATYAKLIYEELPREGITVSLLLYVRVRRLPYIVRHIAFFFLIMKKCRGADIIFAQDPLGVGLPSVAAAKLLFKKAVVRIGGDRAWETGVRTFGVRDDPHQFAGRWFRYGFFVFAVKVGQWLCVSLADAVVVPSEHLREIVCAWGVRSSKIQIVPNAFEGEVPRMSREEARKELDISKKTFLVLSAGRDVPWKGFEMLKHVVQELQSRYPGMRLIILHVVPRGELLRVMRAADLFVLNSWYEGFSHVLLEAAAVGVPILATDVPGNREVLRNEVDALLVPPKAPEALREALERLYRDGKLRGRLADNAKNFSRKFTSQRTVSETKKVLESL